jgi:hypothetical protein
VWSGSGTGVPPRLGCFRLLWLILLALAPAYIAGEARANTTCHAASCAGADAEMFVRGPVPGAADDTEATDAAELADTRTMRWTIRSTCSGLCICHSAGQAL